MCVFCVHKKVSSECLVFVVSLSVLLNRTKISTWKMSLSFFLFLFLAYTFLFSSLSANSAYCSSVGSGHPFSSKKFSQSVCSK